MCSEIQNASFESHSSKFSWWHMSVVEDKVLKQISLKLITAQCWNILYNKTLNVVVAMSSKVYSWRKREKRRLKYAMKWKKVAQSSNTSLRDISQVFGANWFQDISITYHCGRKLANSINEFRKIPKPKNKLY